MSLDGDNVDRSGDRAVPAMKTTRRYQLLADHPALDFVNTLDDRYHPDGPVELITSYDEVLQFAIQSKILTAAEARTLGRVTPRPAAERALRRARALRETVERLFTAVVENRPIASADVSILNGYLEHALKHRIVRSSGLPMVWAWEGITRDPDSPLWAISLGAAELLTSDALVYVRQCACETCRWLFLDTSKNHSRRWCDMKICGDRMKARAYYRRRTSSEDGRAAEPALSQLSSRRARE